MTPPSLIVVNSLVVRGRVGSRAQAFALERLGIEPWLLPTILLPFHPGHGAGTRLSVPEAQFAGLIDDLIARGLSGVRAVLTGYLGTVEQVPHLLRLIAAARAANPDVLVCCDPVIGDAQGLYVDEALALAMLESLVPAADLLCPNRHELAWLTGHPVSTNTEIIEAVSTLASPTVLVTSAHEMMRGNMANLLVHETRAWLAEAQGDRGERDVRQGSQHVGVRRRQLSGNDNARELARQLGHLAALPVARVARDDIRQGVDQSRAVIADHGQHNAGHWNTVPRQRGSPPSKPTGRGLDTKPPCTYQS